MAEQWQLQGAAACQAAHVFAQEGWPQLIAGWHPLVLPVLQLGLRRWAECLQMLAMMVRLGCLLLGYMQCSVKEWAGVDSEGRRLLLH